MGVSVAVVGRDRERERDGVGSRPIMLEDLQRERVDSGLVHDDVVGSADEVAGSAAVGERGEGDVGSVVAVLLVYADVVFVEPGVVALFGDLGRTAAE